MLGRVCDFKNFRSAFGLTSIDDRIPSFRIAYELVWIREHFAGAREENQRCAAQLARVLAGPHGCHGERSAPGPRQEF